MINIGLFNLIVYLPWWVFLLIPLVPFILAGIVTLIVYISERFF